MWFLLEKVSLFADEFELPLGLEGMQMTKCFLSIILLAGVALTQEVSKTYYQVPPEVRKVIKETMNGQNLLVDFDEKKICLGFDHTTKLADLKAGEPIPTYYLHRDSVRKMDDNTPMSKILKIPDMWTVPVLVNGKCFTTFEIWKTEKNPQWHCYDFIGGHKGHYDNWQKVLEAWPESAGYHPVIVYLTMRNKLFHVPEKGDFNLTYLLRTGYDLIHLPQDTSYKVLMSSDKVIRYAKKYLPPSQ